MPRWNMFGAPDAALERVRRRMPYWNTFYEAYRLKVLQ
jgi:hypothetical protein